MTDGYVDAHGVRHETSRKTRAAIFQAMGIEGTRRKGRSSPPEAPVRVIRSGRSLPLKAEAELILEDGTVIRITRALPPDLPLGYHDLRPCDGGPSVRLIVAPRRCHLPKGLRTWGWAIQLYAARTAASWGIGDLVDLRRLASWSAHELGAGLLMLNPLHAATPIVPQDPSPYFPSSRRYRNLLYLRIEEVPGARKARGQIKRLANAGKALNGKRRIDRDRIFRLKMKALEFLWRRFRGDSKFERYRKEQGSSLTQFATFCVLAERFGPGWPNWPRAYRHPGTRAVAEVVTKEAGRVAFHEWVQWLLDDQLKRAGAELPLMQDLPIGFDPGGADAWAWQDLLASGVMVGAPPDEFSANGQNWGLPPFVPHKLRAVAYQPFIETIRATLRHGGGLRIDHVMGLFRLFWIPDGMTPAQGAYVHYAPDELMGIVALESHRAGAVVVGEDLGTVEKSMQKQLAAHDILSYRLVWFERSSPARYRRLALAAVTNHDLPTVAGLWNGTDLQEQQRLNLQPNVEGLQEIRCRLQRTTKLGEDAPVEQVVERAYRLLAKAPSAVLMATLDDALAVAERPNMPGTTFERPNWSLALPVSLESLERKPLPRKIGSILNRTPR